MIIATQRLNLFAIGVAWLSGLFAIAAYNSQIAALYVVGTTAAGVYGYIKLQERKKEQATLDAVQVKQQIATQYDEYMAKTPHLSLGKATGEFACRQAQQAPMPGTIMRLIMEVACRGIAVIGSMGSGKTSAVFYRLLWEALCNGWGALMFAIKDDVPIYAVTYAEKAGRPCVVIGPGRTPYNILRGLEPEAAGAAIGDCMGEPKDPYWRTAPQHLSTMWLKLLCGINNDAGRTFSIPAHISKEGEEITPARQVPAGYTLDALRECIYLPFRAIDRVLAIAADVEKTLADRQDDPAIARRIDMIREATRYFTGDYIETFVSAPNGANNLANIRSCLQPYLGALTSDRALREAYCSTDDDVEMAALLENGGIFCSYIDDSEFPEASKLVNCFLFRRFAAMSQRRQAVDAVPALLWGDEAASFWSPQMNKPLSRMRQAKVIPLLGFQSLSGLAAALGDGGEKAAKGVIGALASLIICGASDPDTASFVRDLVGQVTIREITKSQSEATSTNSGGGPGQYGSSGTSSSETTSEHIRQEWLADGATIASLGPQQGGYVRAIAVVAQNSGGTMRDVVMLPQVPRLV